MQIYGLSRQRIELFLISFGTLCLELCLIRWLPGQVRVVAYFPNLVLIAAFLGLGVGALSRNGGMGRFAAAMSANIAAAIALGGTIIHATGQSEFLWLLYYDLPSDAPQLHGIVGPLSLLFALTTLVFLPLGHAIGVRLNVLKSEGKPLVGYSFDLGGSLGGTLIFLLFSGFGAPPTVWFATAFLSLVPLATPSRRQVVIYSIFVIGLVAAVSRFDRADHYSPYYGLRVLTQETGSVRILTNGSLHQIAFDPRRSTFPAVADLRTTIAEAYHLPVELLARPPLRALVLGAGSGNDVATLLDAGVPEIHAVEIDPAIVEIGRQHHPARPYDDPGVHVHTTDARSFLERTDLSFDLIVFGTLDSMTKLSALSNVRLDNFVYTVDSIQAAKSRLSPDGGMALLFMNGDQNLQLRIFAMIERSWGRPPMMKNGAFGLFNTIYLAGSGYEHLRDQPDWQNADLLAYSNLVSVPTDDWPYLYLESRIIPTFYLQVAAAVLSIAVVLLLMVSKSLRQDLVRGRIDWQMLLFGAAFLLLETAYITQLNLLFGATWIASGVVFASVLAALLLATIFGHYRPVNARVCLGILIGALLLAGSLPWMSFAPSSMTGRILFAAVYCGLPVVGAGLAFANVFAARPDLESAFGWNILGAVIGGLLEMMSMLAGLKAMFVLAALLYALLLFLVIRGGLAARIRASPSAGSTLT